MRGLVVHRAGLLRVGNERMSAVMRSQVDTVDVDDHDDDNHDGPWWTDRGIMVPVFSGVAFLSGLITDNSSRIAIWLDPLNDAFKTGTG